PALSPRRTPPRPSCPIRWGPPRGRTGRRRGGRGPEPGSRRGETHATPRTLPGGRSTLQGSPDEDRDLEQEIHGDRHGEERDRVLAGGDDGGEDHDPEEGVLARLAERLRGD